MALFDADALLRDEDETEVIQLDFLVLPDGMSTPTITMIVNDKIRDVYRKADAKYRTLKIKYHKNETPEGVPVSDTTQFCHEILNEAFVSCEGLFDTSNKKALLRLIKRETGFAAKLATKLVEIFEHKTLFVEDDEKNSSGS